MGVVGLGLDVAVGSDEVIGALDSLAMLVTATTAGAGCSGALASVLMSAAGGKLPLAVLVFTVAVGSSLVSALSLSLSLLSVLHHRHASSHLR